MLWLLIAAQLTTPQASKPLLRPVLTPDDVPVYLVTQNKLETVALSLTVDPSGKVRGCSIEATSGDAKLDSYTCKTVARRTKFPRSANYFVYRTHVDWWIGDTYPPKSVYADLALTVTALPQDLHSPTFVRLKFAVDQAGRISGCTPEGENEPVTLVPTACQELVKAFRAQPARSEDGSPVVSEQDATVMFYTK